MFKHPTAYMWATGVQREIPFGFTIDVTYVGRRGLYLQRERNINQLQPGTIQANPGVNIAALRPYTRLRRDPALGERRPVHLPQPADQRRPSLHQRPEGRARPTRSASPRTTAATSATCSGTPTTTRSTRGRRTSTGATRSSIYYIYDLPFLREQNTLMANLLGGWQISGSTFLRTGTPFSVVNTANDIAGVGDIGFGQPWDQVGDPNRVGNAQLSSGAGQDQNFLFNPLAFAAPAAGTFGNAPRNLLYNPGEQQWDIALFKNFSARRHAQGAVPRRGLQLPQPPEPGRRGSQPEQRQLRPHHEQERGSRDIQLSLRFLF